MQPSLNQHLFCPRCGQQVRAGMIRCRDCGTMLTGDSQPAKSAPALTSGMPPPIVVTFSEPPSTNDRNQIAAPCEQPDAEVLTWTPSMDFEDEAQSSVASDEDRSLSEVNEPKEVSIVGVHPAAEIEAVPVVVSESLGRIALRRVRDSFAIQVGIPFVVVVLPALIFAMRGLIAPSQELAIMGDLTPLVAQVASITPNVPQADDNAVVRTVVASNHDVTMANAAIEKSVSLPPTPVNGAVVSKAAEREVALVEKPKVDAEPIAKVEANEAQPPQAKGAGGAVKVVKLVEPSVVELQVVLGGNAFVTGSGFLCGDAQTVVTNFHVVAGGIAATVRFVDGQVIPIAGFKTVRPEHDLVVLQLVVPAPNREPLKLAEAIPERGSEVYAFGAPKGLAGTVSQGIVSAVRTRVDFEGPLADALAEYAPDSHWIQSTAPISLGNSGGPLVNSDGGVVGAMTWSRIGGQNLNFAVAAKHVAELMKADAVQVRSLLDLPLQDAVKPGTNTDGELNAELAELYQARRELLLAKNSLRRKILPIESLISETQSQVKSAQDDVSTLQRELTRLTQLKKNTLPGSADAVSLNSASNEVQFNGSIAVNRVKSLQQDLAAQQSAIAPLLKEEGRLNQRADQLRVEWIRLVDLFNASWNLEKDQCLKIYSKWIALDDEHAAAFLYRSLTYLLIADSIDDAFSELERAIELKYELGMTWATEAFLRHRKGEPARVLPLFTKALAVKNPPKPFVLYLRGKYYAEIGNFARAQADYRAVIKEKPDHLAAHVGLADLCAACPDEKFRDAGEAAKHATRAAELGGVDCWPALLAAATANAEAGMFDDAIRNAEKALSVAPQTYRPRIQERLKQFREKSPWRISVVKKTN